MANPMQSTIIPDHVELLYPELLSKEGLICILQQRFIGQTLTDLESLDKDALVELYNQYILPLPQRIYRLNRRGREMTKKQSSMAKKRRLEINDASVQPLSKKRVSNIKDPNLDDNPHGSGSRLKPPPASQTLDKKVVKLNTSKVGLNNSNDIIIKDFSKLITLDACKDSTIDAKGDQGKSTGSNQRKRPQTTEENNSEDSNTSSAKRHINKISWP
ncbi:unnamed protein product [Lymnaea stagnalis]|uniref:Ashwin n=1 Tax=Lymnaea stagnalis TaxID=6523 RepID=A0AAV2IC73_LYMST